MREGLELSKAHRQEAMRFMVHAIARAGNELQTAEAVRTLSIEPAHKGPWWEELARAHGRDIATERPMQPVDSYEHYLDYVVGGVDCEMRDKLLRTWSVSVQGGPVSGRVDGDPSRVATLLGAGTQNGRGVAPALLGHGPVLDPSVASARPAADTDSAMLALIPQRFSEHEARVCVQARKVFDVRLEITDEHHMEPGIDLIPEGMRIGHSGHDLRGPHGPHGQHGSHDPRRRELEHARPKGATLEDARRQFVEGAPSLEWTRFFSHLPLPVLVDFVRQEPFELKVETSRTGDSSSDTATHISWREGPGAKKGLKDAVFYIAAQYGVLKGLQLNNAANWLKLQDVFNGAQQGSSAAASYALPALEMLAEWEQTGFTARRTVLGTQTVRLRSQAMTDAVSRGDNPAHQTLRVIHGAPAEDSVQEGKTSGARLIQALAVRDGPESRAPVPAGPSMQAQLFRGPTGRSGEHAAPKSVAERRAYDPYRARAARAETRAEMRGFEAAPPELDYEPTYQSDYKPNYQNRAAREGRSAPHEPGYGAEGSARPQGRYAWRPASMQFGEF